MEKFRCPVCGRMRGRVHKCPGKPAEVLASSPASAEMSPAERLERARQSKRERQQRWREKRGEELGRSGDSVTVHLSNRECAMLDFIARQLYRDNPHDPRAGVVSEVYPGRPEAIRTLVRAYAARHPEARRPASRDACAAFWRRESAFRKATREDSEAEAPVPPWKR